MKRDEKFRQAREIVTSVLDILSDTAGDPGHAHARDYNAQETGRPKTYVATVSSVFYPELQ